MTARIECGIYKHTLDGRDRTELIVLLQGKRVYINILTAAIEELHKGNASTHLAFGRPQFRVELGCGVYETWSLLHTNSAC